MNIGYLKEITLTELDAYRIASNDHKYTYRGFVWPNGKLYAIAVDELGVAVPFRPFNTDNYPEYFPLTSHSDNDKSKPPPQMEIIMGILENIDAKLDAIMSLLKTGSHTNGAAADPFAMPGTGAQAQAQPQQVQATDAMIMELIQPHLANATLKAALQAELAALGINGLPNAQPSQYNDIYARFQRVIAGAGAATGSGGMSLV